MSADQRIAENILRDAGFIDDKVSGLLVQVPFYSPIVQTVQNASVTLFAFDALGATMRDIYVAFYLAASAATFTPGWYTTRPGDLVTFTERLWTDMNVTPYQKTIAIPGAAQWYGYKLGELAQGLQGEFRLAQNALGAANVALDAIAVALIDI